MTSISKSLCLPIMPMLLMPGLLLSGAVFAASDTPADERDGHDGQQPEPHASSEHAGNGHAGNHHVELAYPHHTLGVFIGDTTETRRNQALTLGLEYEYRVNQGLGFGAIVEHVGGDFHTNVAVLPIALHRGPWKLYAGPGVEDSEEEGSVFLMRVGVEYGFHVGDYEISPQIDVDFVDDEHLFIFGVVIARPF